MLTAPRITHAPNILIKKSIASRLENAKNIVEIGQALTDGKGKVLTLGVHTAWRNLNHLANNEGRGRKNAQFTSAVCFSLLLLYPVAR